MQHILSHYQELFSGLLRKHEVGRFPRRFSAKIDKPVISCCGSDEVLIERFINLMRSYINQNSSAVLGKPCPNCRKHGHSICMSVTVNHLTD